MKILEFGSGREWSDWLNDDYYEHEEIHCVDPSFKEVGVSNNVFRHRDDIISFLRKNNSVKFDRVFSNNVIEHIPHTQYQYLFYLLFLNTTEDAKMVIVTADMIKLSEEIEKLNGSMDAKEFNKWYTKCNYAVYADDSPHVSIITPEILKYHAESEGLWDIEDINYINKEDPWEMTVVLSSNKKFIDECRPKNKEILLS